MKEKMQKEAELLKRRSMDVEKQLLQFQQHSKQEKVFITMISLLNIFKSEECTLLCIMLFDFVIASKIYV